MGFLQLEWDNVISMFIYIWNDKDDRSKQASKRNLSLFRGWLRILNVEPLRTIELVRLGLLENCGARLILTCYDFLRLVKDIFFTYW